MSGLPVAGALILLFAILFPSAAQAFDPNDRDSEALTLLNRDFRKTGPITSFSRPDAIDFRAKLIKIESSRVSSALRCLGPSDRALQMKLTARHGAGAALTA